MDEPEEIWLTFRPEPDDLHLFGMAIHLTNTAAHMVSHPLSKALHGVAALGTPAELLELGRRCTAPLTLPRPLPEMSLTAPEAIRLYLSLQVLALLYVSELQIPLLNRLDPTQSDAGPWNDPEQHQAVLTWVCTQVEAFGMLYDDRFGKEPRYQAAKATAQALAALV